MTVAFEELDNSPKESFDDGSFTARRRFKVAWNDRLDFLQELYGGYKMVGGQFVFVPRASYPPVPQAIVTNVEIEPYPPDKPSDQITALSNGINGYPYAIVAATYKIKEDNSQSSANQPSLPSVPDGTFLTYSSDTGGEFLMTPGAAWKSSPGDKTLKDEVGVPIFIGHEDFTLSWQRVARPPWAAMRDIRGHVNASQFMIYEAETVMYLGSRPSIEFQLQQPSTWKLEHRFSVKQIEKTASPGSYVGWNHYWFDEAEAGEHWLKLVDAEAGGDSPYQTADFSKLFQFG